MTTKFQRMNEACANRRAETNSACVLEDCDGIGWCSYVMEQAKQKKGSKNNGGNQPGSGEVEAAKHD